MIVEDQTEVIAFLSRPDSYPGGVRRVERIETHASVVFLAGERAFKLKRAVRFPYLDYSTKELRRRFCHAEVRINRRTAPDIYLGVVAVTRDSEGHLHLGGAGAPVDWLVEMVRFDQDVLFDRLAQQGVLDRFAMEDLADAVARFHEQAERRPDAGGAGAIAATIESNTRSFAECPPGLFDPDKVRRLGEASWRALAKVEALLEARRQAGFVRHCHGDLHLRNIFLHHGHATLFDAIEFSDQLAAIDVLYDLAFLVMDLDHRGLNRLASILFNRYFDVVGDADGLAAWPLFLSMRAAIRSHVSGVATASQSHPAAAAALRKEARDYLELALAYLRPRTPRLIAIGGLSGTGKSRLGRDLAPFLDSVPGARIVRTDCTRKRIAGVPLGQRLGPQGYTPEMTERTYRAVFDECRRVLAAGQSVIADAVFAEPEEREAIERVAEEAGVPFHGLWLEAPVEVMEERVTHRHRNVSDATAWVVRLQLEHDTGEIRWSRLCTAGAKEEILAEALRMLGLSNTEGN